MIDDYDKEENYYTKGVVLPPHTEFALDGECPDCSEKGEDKIGSLSPNLKKQIEKKQKVNFRYGQEIVVLVTKHGIFFRDIC